MTAVLSLVDVAELRAMYKVASRVRGGTPLDDPSRQVGIDLAARYADLIDSGVSVSQIARVVGCSLNAVSQRLARHGHRPLPPSMADVAYRHRVGGR